MKPAFALSAMAIIALLASGVARAASDDIVNNQEFIKKNPHFLDAVRQLIELHGFTCPQVTHLWSHGISPYGQRTEALCGPKGTTDAYPSLHYAVYPDKRLVRLCKPFSAFGPECE
jgi:hypothetical protein